MDPDVLIISGGPAESLQQDDFHLAVTGGGKRIGQVAAGAPSYHAYDLSS